MKTDVELKQIATELSYQVKLLVKSYGTISSLTELNRFAHIKEDVQDSYVVLRSKYNLTDEEKHKVDHMFGRIMIFGARKIWKEKKKVIDDG